MIDLSFLVAWLQSLTPEVVSAMTYLFCVGALVLFYRTLGVAGVFMFIPLVVIAGNIQALKVVQMSCVDAPVAMGTLVFMTSFLATDLLAERHGREIAQKAIWSGFAGVILIVGLMVLTLGIPAFQTPECSLYIRVHQAIETLFLPAPALFVASLIAYLVSQFIDVRLYLWIKKLTHDKQLWLRAIVATALSALIDNIIFSVLAWRILSPLPMDLHTLIFTYILGTYALRLLATCLNMPILYWVKKR
jgi:uncharacterized integral membrane protein (TIGR00697 family)